MLRWLLLVLVAHHTARVTPSSIRSKLDSFYEQLERLTVAPPEARVPAESKLEEWHRKLQKLDALKPGLFSDEDEELLEAMQTWGRLSAAQLDGVARDLQTVREDRDEEREYNDLEDVDEDIDDYHNDGAEDDEEEEYIPSLPSRGVTPSAFTREEVLRHTVVSAVDPIAATNARPRILSDEPLSALERSELRKSALANIGRVVRAGRCLVPQPRWLSVRQLAPAADTVYMPPCVELHRCAPDSGCCNNEAEVCAPIQGSYVALPFYLNKADGTMSVARMLFFNHTQCACVSRDTLQTTIRNRPQEQRPRTEPTKAQHAKEERVKEETVREEHAKEDSAREEHILAEEHTKAPPKDEHKEDGKEDERQNDWNMATERPKLDEEDVTAPPQMRRCTCPGQFLASMAESGPCSCVCEWPDAMRRRSCLPLSRGEEHFGLRDRVCVDTGDCAPPSCKYGAYDRKLGKCPARKYRRFRYHRRFHPDKTLVV